MKRKIMAFVLTLSILMSTFVPGTLATSAASDSSSTQVVVENQETTDNCPYCEETTAEDGTVTHAETCNTLFAYDGTADIGKYVKLNDYFAMVSVRYDVTSSDDYSYDYTDFETDQIFEIVNYHYEVETSGVWYLVKTYSGTMPTDTPEQIWILQNYTVDGDSENALLFVSTCEDCGKPDCTTNHNAPITEAVIPETPTLTEGEAVSLVDATGAPITNSEILRIKEGAKFSMSAWTGLTDNGDETYQWQISAEETGGVWVSISGQTSKGLLTSLAMFNTFKTLPSIRCQITTGGQTFYSQEISVTALKEDTRTDSSSNVSVSGLLPLDAELSVTPQTVEETGLTEEGYAIDDVSLFNDITLTRGGTVEYQPEDGEYLTITFLESAVTEAGLQVGDTYRIYHVNGDEVYVSDEMVYDGGDITMTFDKLSTFGFSKTVVTEEGTADNCPYCEETTAEDGTVTHAETCNTLFAYDGTTDIGKYVKLNDYFAMVSVRYDVTSSDDYSYYYDDFETDQIFEIVNYYYEVETSGIWYLVKTYTGSMPEDTPEQIWILQDYTVGGDSENALLFLSICEDCGKPDCTTNHNTPIMTKCAICGKENCTTQHLYCEEHSAFDCDATHTKQESSKPVTEPAIPANPTLTVGADVSIADEYGDPVTEDGFVLLEGTRSSLSAWSDSENVSYQWQIRTDDGTWVDIQGQTAQGILISPAMFVSVVNPAIRCEVTSGETVEYSAEIPVTVENSVANVSMFSLARTANNVAATAEDGTTTPELGEYTVVINYVFENNVVVADPYTATLAAGSNFSATVKNPTVMGYLPYVGDAAETSENVQLNITNIQADVTYTVTYKPTNVNYTVIHYWQNLDNDNYTEHERETLQGLTKSTVGEVAKTYPGFYTLLYERPEIAADGSTVVEIYYDREYYLMIFNLGEGGYGVDPIYARYGAPVNIGEPTRPGYTFDGWSPEVPDTVPVDGGRYTAQWTAVDEAKVKVVIYGENPNDEEYSYLTTGEVMVKPGTEYTYNGTDQLYLYCDQEAHTHGECSLTCGKTEHTQHTDACYGCEHTHSLNCYSTGSGYYNLLRQTTKPDEITDYGADGVYTYTTTESIGPYEYEETHYYLYIDGTWYCAARERQYIGGVEYSDTTEISVSCSHTHTDSCYTCEYHEHTDVCYGCGKEAHTHDSTCTGTVEGLDSDLWTFVSSETVTVAADGSSVIKVYYDRVSYSVQFYSDSDCRDSDEYTDIRITAKWGANIVNEWPTYNGSSSWLIPGKNNTWQNGIQVMPVGGAKFWGPKTGSSSYTAYYYVEALPGATDTIEHNGVTYVLHHTDTSSSSGNVTIEEQYAIEGFTYKEGTAIGQSYANAKFYYTRHKYAIEFYNPTDLLKTETGIPYQAPLSSYDWTPDATMAPDKYEPGSVEFEGWYLDPECVGDKYDFTTHTMPVGTNDGDTTLTLYANWVPVTRIVNFYHDKADMESGTDLIATRTTPHGSLLKNPVDDLTDPNYEFIGWFYMDGDEEKAFLFTTMVITKDMDVYGKWSSNVLKEYTVYYKIQGTDTQIAEPTTGSGLAGVTKTFDAKGGTDLYVGYQEGYFPLIESHSMTLNIEHNDNEGDNTYTFYYVQKDAVPYTVYYVAETLKDGDTGLGTIERDGKTYYIIAETYTNSENRKAVVTEKFKQVSGYMPDAYQKRLVVDGSDDAVNEIIFYYSVDSTHAYYKITHYTQNTDGENWAEYASSQAVGDIGQTYSADPLTIDGFTFDSTVTGTVTSGELTANGLELKLYYVRNSYPYEVRYLEQGSGKQLADPKPGTGLYGAVVSESAIDIANYTAVDPTSQTLTIKIEEDATAKLNIITFYYTEQEVEIKYVAVGNGTVTDPSNTNTAGASGSETLKVLSGTAQGSTATADKNYKFVGWYSDEECTKLVSENAKYVPEKVDDKNVAATYYAKFELDVADLTITKTGEINTYDADQSFIFRVTGPNGFSLDVVINGTGSVTIKDLPIGTYTVKEITEWSWRYTPDGGAEKSVTLGAGENKVTFNNVRNDNIYWLAGDSFKENQFTVKPKNDEE